MTRLTCTVLTVLALAGCTTRPSPPPVDINSVLGQTLPPSPARQRLESLNEDIAECAREADRGAGLDRYAMARSRQCMELRGHRTTSPRSCAPLRLRRRGNRQREGDRRRGVLGVVGHGSVDTWAGRSGVCREGLRPGRRRVRRRRRVGTVLSPRRLGASRSAVAALAL